MIRLVTPTPARTESEMPPAMLLSTMADTTASPLRNREEEPTLATCQRILAVGRKFRMLMCRRLLRVA